MTANVRYMVNDVETAVAFYSKHLGFELKFQPGPGFAVIERGDLRLFLNTPTGPGGAAQPMPDGRRPEPGGWNRIQLEVDDLSTTVDELRTAGVTFRNEVQDGKGGKQVLLDDPSGNPVELFEPAPD